MAWLAVVADPQKARSASSRAGGGLRSAASGVAVLMAALGALMLVPTVAGSAYHTIVKPQYLGPFLADPQAHVRIRVSGTPYCDAGDAILVEARNVLVHCVDGIVKREYMNPLTVKRTGEFIYHVKDESTQPDFDYHEVFEIRAVRTQHRLFRGFLYIRSSECSTDGRLRWEARRVRKPK